MRVCRIVVLTAHLHYLRRHSSIARRPSVYIEGQPRSTSRVVGKNIKSATSWLYLSACFFKSPILSAPRSTNRCSLRQLRAYQNGAAWSHRALFWPNWRCKISHMLSQIVGHTRRITTLLVKSLLTVHSLVNNPYRFSLVFHAIEPLSFTNPATAWCSCCFVHLCPMTFFQVSPLRMIDIIAIIHNTHAHPCCIILQAGL